MPQLVTTINEMERIGAEKGKKFSGLRNCYGRCFIKDRIVFVNTNTRVCKYKTYMRVRYSQYYMSKHKATYRDCQHTLVHELIHYRFRYLQHGATFEQRIREILHGKVFPQKQLFNNNDETDEKG
jgi:hypothetical protein